MCQSTNNFSTPSAFSFFRNSSRKQKQRLEKHNIRYCTVRYSTVRYGTVRYGTVQYSTVQYSTVQVADEPSVGMNILLGTAEGEIVPDSPDVQVRL